MIPKVLYEDKNLLVVDKPAGLLVHLVKGKLPYKNDATLADWLLENYPQVAEVGDKPLERPGIVHRLDRETSGVMVVALNQKTFEYLKDLFKTHQVQKTYIALVWGDVKKDAGSITKPIGIVSGTTRRSVIAKNMKMLREAVTDYKVLKRFKLGEREATLLEVSPKTGRTHQIRVHLASINHPIVGDAIYGSGRKQENEKIGITRQFLHADAIEFSLPEGGRLKISSELPDELKKFIL